MSLISPNTIFNLSNCCCIALRVKSRFDESPEFPLYLPFVELEMKGVVIKKNIPHFSSRVYTQG